MLKKASTPRILACLTTLALSVSVPLLADARPAGKKTATGRAPKAPDTHTSSLLHGRERLVRPGKGRVGERLRQVHVRNQNGRIAASSELAAHQRRHGESPRTAEARERRGVLRQRLAAREKALGQLEKTMTARGVSIPRTPRASQKHDVAQARITQSAERAGRIRADRALFLRVDERRQTWTSDPAARRLMSKAEDARVREKDAIIERRRVERGGAQKPQDRTNIQRAPRYIP